LRLVDGAQILDSLYFDDDLTIHKEVKSITAIEKDALVPDRKRDFGLIRNLAQIELASKALLIGRLK
jgi:hypothetical protein